MKIRSRMTLAMVLVTGVLSCSPGSADDGTVLEKWKFRKALLNQFRCEYSLVSTKFPTPEERRKREYRSPDGTVVIRPDDGPVVYDGVCVFDSQRIRHTSQYPDPGFTRDPKRQISRVTSIYTPEKFESLTESFRKTRPTGLTDSPKGLPLDFYLDVALGLRMWGTRDKLSDERIREAQIEDLGEGQMKVNFLGPNGTLFTAGVSLRNGFDILSWNLYDAQGQKRLEIIPSGYTDEGSLSIPHLIETTTYRADGSLMVRTEMKIKRFEYGPESVNDETFQIEWPTNAVKFPGLPFM